MILADQMKNHGSGDFSVIEDEYTIFVDHQEGSCTYDYGIINTTNDSKMFKIDLTDVNGGNALLAPSTGLITMMVRPNELKFVGAATGIHKFSGEFDPTGF